MLRTFPKEFLNRINPKIIAEFYGRKPTKKAPAKEKGKGKAKVVEEHISAEMIEDSGDALGAGMQLGDAPQPQHEPGRSTPSASSSKSVDEPAVPKPNGTYIFLISILQV